MSKKKYVQTTIRVEEEVFREYKKWLIDKGYKSINQHLNEVIRKALEAEGIVRRTKVDRDASPRA